MAEEGANRRIVKNTVFLYIRSLLMMAVNLYASRVILQALGVDDYGLYNAVGSIVTMFAILNGVLSMGTSRFLTFELGKGDKVRLQKTFSASFSMHVALAIVLLFLMETVGLWFVNNKLNIPEGREFAANVVYQFSILSCMLTLTQVPYSAVIIAHERMNIYAYVGVFEALFKLGLVLLLLYIPFSDNLIAYAIIVALWSVGLQIYYRIYCLKQFEESRLSLCRDKTVYKSMLSYSVWDFIGQFCSTGNNQGLNILINIFFGVSVNAGRAIAYQVENVITQFSGNFMTSINPQIVKSYAQKDYHRFFELIYEAGKYSFFLLFIISLPIFLEANYILGIWLIEVPDTTVAFLRFVMYYTLFRMPMRSVVMGVHATGNVKYLNLSSGCYSACTFLLAIYLAYRVGAPFWACFIVQAFNGILIMFFELTALKRNIAFSRTSYLGKSIIIPWLLVLVASIPAVVSHIYMNEGFIRFLTTGLLSVGFTSLSVFYFGISKEARRKVIQFAINKIKR